MARDLRFSEAAVNAKATALASLLDGGTLKLYSGSRPASADDPVIDQTVLAELAFDAPAFAPASGGMLVAHPLAPDTKTKANGEATWYRAYAADGTAVMDGSVGTQDANLVLPNAVILENYSLSVSSFTLSVPAE